LLADVSDAVVDRQTRAAHHPEVVHGYQVKAVRPHEPDDEIVYDTHITTNGNYYIPFPDFAKQLKRDI